MGIIHRDVKPENVLLTVSGHIKISDLGSAARITFPETWIEPSDTVQFGTAAYLAPEVIAGFPYDFAIDWWCLGIIIYEMVLGEVGAVSRHN
jgi:serine/threonine protein kinase